MARLIFDKVCIGPAATAANALNTAITVGGIITDSITVSEEALQVAIEDNQNINEGYTTTMSFRTRDIKALDGTTNIASGDAASLTFSGGSSVLAKKRLHMFGINGSDDFYVDNVYVMGRRVFENGREEVEVSCQIDSTSQQIVRA